MPGFGSVPSRTGNLMLACYRAIKAVSYPNHPGITRYWSGVGQHHVQGLPLHRGQPPKNRLSAGFFLNHRLPI